MKYSILMADIIDSGRMDSRHLMDQFKKLVTRLNLLYSKQIISPLTITLGDEFQGIIKTTEDALKIIFTTEEELIRTQSEIKLRYVLSFGEIQTRINKKIAYEMLGPGLKEARFKLNEMKKEQNRFHVKLHKDFNAEEYLNKAFIVYQNFTDNWKRKDKKTVSEFLANNDYKTVARKIHVDPSSAWRRKKSLKITEYEAIKEIILYINLINTEK